MKIGFRKPSLRKSIAARTSLKRAYYPRMPRGYGFLRNPKKALYNKVYYRTTASLGDTFGWIIVLILLLIFAIALKIAIAIVVLIFILIIVIISNVDFNSNQASVLDENTTFVKFNNIPILRKDYDNDEETEEKIQIEKEQEFEKLPLVYNDDIMDGLDVDPLFVETASVVVAGQICNYNFLYKTMGLYPNRVDDLVKQLIKHGIVAEKRKKETMWKVLVKNDLQLEILFENLSNKKT